MSMNAKNAQQHCCRCRWGEGEEREREVPVVVVVVVVVGTTRSVAVNRFESGMLTNRSGTQCTRFGEQRNTLLRNSTVTLTPAKRFGKGLLVRTILLKASTMPSTKLRKRLWR